MYWPEWRTVYVVIAVLFQSWFTEIYTKIEITLMLNNVLRKSEFYNTASVLLEFEGYDAGMNITLSVYLRTNI